MPGFWAIPVGQQEPDAALRQCLNPLDLPMATRSSTRPSAFRLNSAWREPSPLAGPRLLEQGPWQAAFAGDLIEHRAIPWDRILRSLESPDRSDLRSLEGIWTAFAHDSRSGMSYLVSDRTSQHPVFYRVAPGSGLAVSTALSLFSRLADTGPFDPRWLWEVFFFNFPIAGQTFLQGVRRLPPATVLEHQAGAGLVRLESYATPYSRSGNLLPIEASITRGTEVLDTRLPLYFDGSLPTACALSGGWDGRTVLAYGLPRRPTTYTYGTPGCSDIVAAGGLSRALGLEHREILFAGPLLERLPGLVADTVYATAALENPLRSPVLYAYDELTRHGHAFPLLVSGLLVDVFLRGHAHSPSLVSAPMAQILAGAPRAETLASGARLLRRRDDARAHIEATLQELEGRFGPAGDSCFHFLYYLYEVAPKYFGGEFSMASQFSTMRIPFLDSRIIEFCLSSSLSTLTFSQYLPDAQRGRFDENLLQSRALSSRGHPALVRWPIRGMQPRDFTRGKAFYWLQKVRRRAPAAVLARLRPGGRSRPLLEDWDAWLSGPLRATVEALLFGREARLRDHLTDECFTRARQGLDKQLLKLMLLGEITLRLMETGWRRPR